MLIRQVYTQRQLLPINTLITFCSTTVSSHSMKDSTVALFFSKSLSSWKTAMESSISRQREVTEKTALDTVFLCVFMCMCACVVENTPYILYVC